VLGFTQQEGKGREYLIALLMSKLGYMVNGFRLHLSNSGGDHSGGISEAHREGRVAASSSTRDSEVEASATAWLPRPRRPPPSGLHSSVLVVASPAGLSPSPNLVYLGREENGAQDGN